MAEGQPRPRPIEVVAGAIKPRYADLVVVSDNPVVLQTFEAFMDLATGQEPLSSERMQKIEEIKGDKIRTGKAVVLIKKLSGIAEDADTFRESLGDSLDEQLKRVQEAGGSLEEIERVENELIAGFESIAEVEGRKMGLEKRPRFGEEEQGRSGKIRYEGLREPKFSDPQNDGERKAWLLKNIDPFRKRIEECIRSGTQITQGEQADLYLAAETFLKVSSDFVDSEDREEFSEEMNNFKKVVSMLNVDIPEDLEKRKAGRKVGRESSSSESLAQIARLIKEKEGYDITNPAGLTTWIRDQMKIILLENENRAVDIEHSLRSSVGVFPIGIEQILEWLPSDFAKEFIVENPQTHEMGPMILEDYVRRIKIEMGLQSKCQSRRQQLSEVKGSLDEEAKKLKSFSAAGDFLGMTANDLEDNKDLLPFWTFKRNPNGKIDSNSGERIDWDPSTKAEMEEFESSEVLRRAMGRYELMRMVWQDGVPLAVKIDKGHDDYTITVLKKAFKLPVNQGTWAKFNESLDSPNFGFDSDFGKKPTEAEAKAELLFWLRENGYVPENANVQLNFSSNPEDMPTEGVDASKVKKWLVPGPLGRKALKELKRIDGQFRYDKQIRLYCNSKENWNQWGDMNFYYEGFGGSTPAQIETVRKRIRAWVVGVNPDDPVAVEANREKINKVGWLFERAANSYFYSTGGASYLDTSGVGKTGLNLLAQTQRYLDGQKGSGRLGGSTIIRKNLNRFIGTETDLLRVMRKNRGGSLTNLYTGEVQNEANYTPTFAVQLLRNDGVRYKDLEFLSGRINPDKDFADSVGFMALAFMIARGDQPLELSSLANELRWGGPPVINPKVEAPIISLWKSLYLGVNIAGWNNAEVKMVRDVLDEDNPWVFKEEKGPRQAIDVPRFFHQLFILSDAIEHYANWFGFSNAVNGQPMTGSDELVMEKVLYETLKQERVSWMTDGGVDITLSDHVYYPSEVRRIQTIASGKSESRRNAERIFGWRG